MLADDSGMLTTHIINWRVLRIKIGYLPFATCATLPLVVVDVDLLKHIFMDGGSMDGRMDGINNRNGLFVHRLIDILVSLFVHRATDNRKIKCNYFDDSPKAEEEFPECETKARKTGMNKKCLG